MPFLIIFDDFDLILYKSAIITILLVVVKDTSVTLALVYPKAIIFYLTDCPSIFLAVAIPCNAFGSILMTSGVPSIEFYSPCLLY